jgi:hypothetical protein
VRSRQDLSVYVQLQLVCGGVADSDGTGAPGGSL